MKSSNALRVTAALLVAFAAFFGVDKIGPAIAQSSLTAYYRAMFHVNSRDVSGQSNGLMQITGGGSYDWDSSFLRGSGSYSCLEAVGDGPLSGCAPGQGTRWETDDLFFSTQYRCYGGPDRVAVTGASTVVFLANFYRAGDGRVASLRAKMIVSMEDLDPDVPGFQQVWIEGVGCGT
jgi:hypothetical protein